MSQDNSLFLSLWHGRRSWDQQLDDWGAKGPVFGPLSYVHCTYASDIKFCYFGDPATCELKFVSDLVYYDGVYYGDWAVCGAAERAPIAFAVDRAELPPRCEECYDLGWKFNYTGEMPVVEACKCGIYELLSSCSRLKQDLSWPGTADVLKQSAQETLEGLLRQHADKHRP